MTVSLDKPLVTTLDAIVSRDELERALAFTTLGVARRAPAPILTGVRIHAWNDRITLSTFDFETLAWQHVNAPGAYGSAIVPHKALLDLVKSLPKGAVVTIRAESEKVTVSDGDVTFRLNTLPEEEWPETPTSGGLKVLDMPGAEFHSMITRVAIAASKDDTLPLLTQIKFDTSSAVTLYGTDRYRLTAYATSQFTKLDRSPLIAAKLLTSAAAFFKTSHTVTVSADTQSRTGALGGFWNTISDATRGVTAVQHEGDYPAVQRLFPDNVVTSVDLDSADTLKALKQVGVALTRNRPVRLEFHHDLTLLKAGDADDISAERPLKAIATTDDVLKDSAVEFTAFNPTFMKEGIEACGGDITHLDMTHRAKPVLFTNPATPEFRYLLVPIRFAA